MQAISLFIYNLSLWLYQLGIKLAAPFNAKAKQWVEGRKTSIPAIVKNNGTRVAWVHCASLGEFEQARPLIEYIRVNYSNVKIVLTFFSPSGYEVRKSYNGADHVLYLPLDTKSNAKTFVENIKPDIALFVKYEFWYHYLSTLKIKAIPTVLFSGIFRENQIFFKPYGALHKKMLKCFSKIFVQNEESKLLLNGIGIECSIANDTRFDRVITIAENHNTYPLIAKFKDNKRLMVAGSTWPKDETLIHSIIQQGILAGYKYIIAPHNINIKDISTLVQQLPSAIRWSELNEANAIEAQIVVIDNIGHLAHIYAYANIVYVGGGFNVSVHNVLEPAVFGVPIIFGPNHTKSNEAIELQNEGAAYSITNLQQLKCTLERLQQENSKQVDISGSKAKQYVYKMKGGTLTITAYIHHLLQEGYSL